MLNSWTSTLSLDGHTRRHGTRISLDYRREGGAWPGAHIEMPAHVAQVLMATVAMSTHCATFFFAYCKSIKMIPSCLSSIRVHSTGRFCSAFQGDKRGSDFGVRALVIVKKTASATPETADMTATRVASAKEFSVLSSTSTCETTSALPRTL